MSQHEDQDGIFGSSGNYQIAPAGNHIAICTQVVLLGTIERTFEGHVKKATMIRLAWELPNALMEAEPGEDAKPFTLSQDYLLSMGSKANLYKMICSWAGKALSQEDAKKFNIKNVLGFACMLNVIHESAKNGNTYAKIAAVTPAPQGMPVPQPKTDLIFFNYNPPFKSEAFNKLPEFVKSKIKTSDEYMRLQVQGAIPSDPLQQAPAWNTGQQGGFNSAQSTGNFGATVTAATAPGFTPTNPDNVPF